MYINIFTSTFYTVSLKLDISIIFISEIYCNALFHFTEGSECPHFMKAVNLGKLRKVVKDKKWSSACSDCQKHGDPVSNNEDEVLFIHWLYPYL